MKKIVLALLLLMALAFAQSIDTLKKEGEKGNVEALMKLALIYEDGKGVEQNLKLAKRYYLQAKELGSKDAIIALSLLELSANSNKISHINNSVKIKAKSGLTYSINVDDLKNIVARAKENDSEALYTLATLYDNGYGVIKADSKKALLLYIKSAKLGNQKAKEVLALKKDSLKK